MFGINSWELLILVALFMLLFGPERLPEVIGQVTRLARDLQRMADEATSELRRELETAVGEPLPPFGPASARPADAAPEARQAVVPEAPSAAPLGLPAEAPSAAPLGPPAEKAEGSSGAAAPTAAPGQPAPSPSIFRVPDREGPEDAGTP
jgi:Sec-independent protein translocase protein TatA